MTVNNDPQMLLFRDPRLIQLTNASAQAPFLYLLTEPFLYQTHTQHNALYCEPSHNKSDLPCIWMSGLAGQGKGS